MPDSEMSLWVQEIFESIQGESRLVGYPTTFVRLVGCNLKCVWCDEGYGEYYKEKFKRRPRRKMTVENIVHEVSRKGHRHVCITGGEPLLNDNVWILVYELVGKNYVVSIETNGSVPLHDTRSNRSFFYVMDVKMPKSGEHHKLHLPNLARLKACDDVKFVIADREDYEYAKKILRTYPTSAMVHFSPVVEENGDNRGDDLAKWILEDKLNVRLTLQMHRYIGWGVDSFGIK